MNACIISIGDELLIGQTINTNAAWLGEKLGGIGVSVKKVVTIGDDRAAIEAALDDAMQEHEIVLVTGGLGPTHDDITKDVVTRYFGAKLVFHEDLLNRLKAYFEARGYKLPANNESQAWLPDKAKILPNRVGSAQGMLFERDGRFCLAMPGVPREMQCIMEDSGLAFLKEKNRGNVVLHHTWRTVGVPESKLAEMIGDIDEVERFGKLAFLPKFGGVDLRVSVQAANYDDAEKRIASAGRLIIEKAGKFIYATGAESLQEVIGRRLVERGETMAVAESCTGGLICRRITETPGSSQYFPGGVVAYSNAQKVNFLGVSEKTLEQFGAVSDRTAREMAAGVREKMDADYAISTTGVAGPSGGTPEKPVGLIYIGLATKNDVIAKKFLMTKDRKINQERSAIVALSMLYKSLF